ncbi:MAG: electron transport complex subunit RsxC, partial [Gammaproteobacteria bacterium]|nr:electron transport complex subunit RsxC [Gammaproteobacteria bacterium]
EIGDHVEKGQLIARAQGFVSANLHAPINATVKAIELRPVPHPSGLDGECIILKPDEGASWSSPVSKSISQADIKKCEPQDIRQKIRNAGIVGMGGATFPTSVKIKTGIEKHIDTLIINGCECEPWITCDEMLFRERPQHVIGGSCLIQQAIKADKRVLAIEEEESQAIDLLRNAIVDCGDPIQLEVLPSRYPTGSEKQLIEIITNKQVPSDGLPADIGLAVYNAATAAAIFRAVVYDEPLISRFVTISGMGIRHPRVLEVLLGTPVSTLLEFCGGQTDDANGLIMGGVMMGLGLVSGAVPVTKGMNAVLVTTPAMMQDTQGEMPCIRCGECATVCPSRLAPQQLLSLIRADDLEQAQRWNLEDCIECGCCNAVCPSHIPLASYYRYAKGEIRAQGNARAKAQHAKQRYEFRNDRIERAKREREERLKKKKEALKAKEAAATDNQATPEAPE